MKKNAPRPKTTLLSAGISPRATIAKLAESPLLDKLNHHELVIYIRLLGAKEAQRSERVSISNRQLYGVPRTARRTLVLLEQRGLIRCHEEGQHPTGPRSIEVF